MGLFGTGGDFFPHRSTPGGSVAIGGAVTSGTEGSILFLGPGGVLAQDNANFFYDDTDNQLVLGAGTVGKPSLIFGDDTSGLYRPAADNIGVALAGVAALRLGALGPDSDQVLSVGRALMHSVTTDIAFFCHRDMGASGSYAMRQNAAGATRLNCASGQTLQLMHADGAAKITVNTTGLGFFAVTPVAQQTGPVLTITNSITAGGTDGTFTNWTDLSVYATDAAAIRNAIYQVGRTAKFCSDALRAYGLLT